jgi:gamma-glutamylcysteine synthetase
VVQGIYGRRILRYCNEFKALLESRIAGRSKRTFGFEYELLGENPLSPEDFKRVQNSIPYPAFSKKNGLLISDEGMYITFEPGGQLEFSSPPMHAAELSLFDSLLTTIKNTVGEVREKASVNYLPVPYMPDRAVAPMLLDAKRYHDLHSLLGKVSDRGREMMKGTASIHLHVSLMSFDELLPMWTFMCSLSLKNGFSMGDQRRDIWNKTDPSRCGLSCAASLDISSSDILLENLICFALNALDLHSGIPFGSIDPYPSFDDFLVHFSTIFTDVRLNTKGMTLELRTLDSRPLHMFRGTWITFLNMVQHAMDDNN